MNSPSVTVIEILGKIYQIKCAEEDTALLKKAASMLEEKMKTVRDQGNFLSLDKIAIISALNISYQLLSLENQNQHQTQTIQQRLKDLQQKIETALKIPFEMHEQMELHSAE